MRFKLSISAMLFFTLGLSACTTTSQKGEENLAGAARLSKGANRSPASHAWGNYHWARTTPQFTLKLIDNLTSTNWKYLLGTASQDWNSPTNFGASSTPILTSVVTGAASRKCSMVAGATRVCNGKYGSNGWLGLASINIVNGEHITQGTAKMNDSYFTTSKYNNNNEKLHVMCQEIAHTFGLDHQSVDGTSLNTCMDYFSNTGVNATSAASTKPNAHDFQKLNEIYAHLDTTTTVSPLSAASTADEVNEDPRTWGDHRREKSEGQSALYERRHRDGSITITHVYWTPERAARCKDCDHRDDR